MARRRLRLCSWYLGLMLIVGAVFPTATSASTLPYQADFAQGMGASSFKVESNPANAGWGTLGASAHRCAPGLEPQ
jgi:hypothetical protein